ncbi:hypothetical protein BGW80DRAFT_1342424 [Lactifluus volemus]|nr:hypothetical protein BGW80DRAFT_1342424 [Lactifluus volemus]
MNTAACLVIPPLFTQCQAFRLPGAELLMRGKRKPLNPGINSAASSSLQKFVLRRASQTKSHVFFSSKCGTSQSLLCHAYIRYHIKPFSSDAKSPYDTRGHDCLLYAAIWNVSVSTEQKSDESVP